VPELDRRHETRDPVYRAAQFALYLALFFSSFLVFRAGPLAIGDLFLLASIVLIGVSRGLTPNAGWPRSPFQLGPSATIVAMLIIGSLLAVSEAQLPADSLSIVVRLVLVVFVLPWVARLTLPSVKELGTALVWFVAGAAVSSSGTIVQYIAGSSAIPGAGVTQAGRFTGFTGHVSDMGGVASLGLVFALGFVVSGRRRVFAVVALLISAVGLILSGSVSGFIAVGVGILVYLLRGALKIRYAVLIVGLGAGVLAISSTLQGNLATALSPLERVQQALGLTAKGRYATSDIRTETYSVAVEKIIGSPLVGHGFDSSSWIVDGVFPAHNLVIGALYQGGILVAVALVLMLARPVTKLWFLRHPDLLTTQLLAGFSAAAVFAMTAPSLYNRYLWIPVALLGVAYVLSRIVDSETVDSSYGPARRHTLAAQPHP
jgi:hypothetical protein